ncbi:MAG: hypothetical protein QNJ94_21355 [Alphaproteobacteria bacterium]|nr:hypothetical protein [Alphaproteobacteria bacterium]
MVVTHEVGTYRVLLISGYGGVGGIQVGFVYFYTPTNQYVGYVGIIKDGAPLPDNVQHPNGILNIYFHEAELVALLDTLRNERPVYVRYHTNLKWGSVGTDREPVGEDEEPAGP